MEKDQPAPKAPPSENTRKRKLDNATAPDTTTKGNVGLSQHAHQARSQPAQECNITDHIPYPLQEDMDTDKFIALFCIEKRLLLHDVAPSKFNRHGKPPSGNHARDIMEGILTIPKRKFQVRRYKPALAHEPLPQPELNAATQYNRCADRDALLRPLPSTSTNPRGSLAKCHLWCGMWALKGGILT